MSKYISTIDLNKYEKDAGYRTSINLNIVEESWLFVVVPEGQLLGDFLIKGDKIHLFVHTGDQVECFIIDNKPGITELNNKRLL